MDYSDVALSVPLCMEAAPANAPRHDREAPTATKALGEALWSCRWLLHRLMTGVLACLTLGTAAGQSLTNPSFESPQIPSSMTYSPTAEGWTFTSATFVSGITANGSPFMTDSAPTPDGRQVAVIQGEGRMSQAVNLSKREKCVVSFIAQQRAGNQDPTGIRLQVEVDGTAFLYVAPERWAFKPYSGSFTAAAGSHQLAFHGSNPARSDNTVFIDSVALSCTPAPTLYQADYVSQQVPATMIAGQPYSVSVTMRNNGTDSWNAADQYRLGSQNAQDNTTWGVSRIDLPTSVSPDQTVTFKFTVTAPVTPGDYSFQWQMVRDGVKWFGALTQNQIVNVTAAPQPRPSRTKASKHPS